MPYMDAMGKVTPPQKKKKLTASSPLKSENQVRKLPQERKPLIRLPVASIHFSRVKSLLNFGGL